MKTVNRPLKRFGQHFLVDSNIQRKILNAIDLSCEDTVLEIGPGKGELTFELAKRARRLFAVEVDRRLCQGLKEKFKSIRNTEIICADILRLDFKRVAGTPGRGRLRVVGNLPYCLTTPIIEYLFEHIRYIDDIFITVQKEVAQRMTAQPQTKAYGSLTCFVNYFCQPKILFGIKAGSFWPAPKVESCLVRLNVLKNRREKFSVKSEHLLFEVIRSAFGQRRKKILTSLSCILDKRQLRSLIPEGFLSLRAEELNLCDFVYLSNLIFDFSKKR